MIPNEAGVWPRISPSASTGKGRPFHAHLADAQFGDVAVREVRAPVHLRQRGEGVGLGPGHDEHVEQAVAGVGFRRDLHAAAVEPAVRHRHVERPPAVRVAIGVEPHRRRAEARQGQPEPAGVPGAAEEPAEPLEPGRPGHHRAAQAGLGDVDEVPGRGRIPARAGNSAGHGAHVDEADTVPGQVPGCPHRVARQAERPDEVAPGARRHNPEHGVGHERPAAGDHPVDHLVHGPVPADRDQVALAVSERVPRGLGGVAGMGGPHDAVAEFGVPQDVLDLRQRRLQVAAPGPRVDDEDQRAEGAAHGASFMARGFMTRGFMMPAGSRAARIRARTSTPVAPRSPVRNLAFSRPTP